MFRPYAALVDGEIEYRRTHAAYVPDPIAIGAVGGSGTRVLAQVLAQAGVTMATPSNEAHLKKFYAIRKKLNKKY